MKPRRPVLRYFGGKFRIRNWITGFFPPHRIYVEPYGGAGSVLLAKEPSFAEVYNDLDGEVVNLFRVLRDPDQGQRLRELLDLTPFSRAEFTLSYEPSPDPIESARRLVTRCFLGFGATAHNSATRTGFRGKSWRSNQTGLNDWKTYPEALPGITARLREVMIEQRPAFDLIARHDGPETLFYVDPPYVHSTRGRHHDTKSRYRFEMDDLDHRHLALHLRGSKGMVVLSGYDSPLYRELYGDWERFEREAVADGARPRTELIWINQACSAALKHKANVREIAG